MALPMRPETVVVEDLSTPAERARIHAELDVLVLGNRLGLSAYEAVYANDLSELDLLDAALFDSPDTEPELPLDPPFQEDVTPASREDEPKK